MRTTFSLEPLDEEVLIVRERKTPMPFGGGIAHDTVCIETVTHTRPSQLPVQNMPHVKLTFQAILLGDLTSAQFFDDHGLRVPQVRRRRDA
ncbi:hypothetical protein Bca52824_037458 [Brassica carinata]|uniref:Uncharacterized protein n=1 Tax=Brassica carinata TaxID=52824 RepID=A0A8X7S7H9_BRACI|nr:hypothetical protein Bca52824_037458 [Brassica carinata]